MWHSKKVIISAVLAVVLLFGIIGGVALAQENEDNQPRLGFLDRLADKLGITTEELKDKIAEVRAELPERDFRCWTAKRGVVGCLKNIEEVLGIDIDEDALREALIDARDRIKAGEDRQEVIAEVFEEFGIDMEDLKAKCEEFRESHQQMFGERPDGRFFGPRFGFKGPRVFPRMGGMRGFGGPCAPTE